MWLVWQSSIHILNYGPQRSRHLCWHTRSCKAPQGWKLRTKVGKGPKKSHSTQALHLHRVHFRFRTFITPSQTSLPLCMYHYTEWYKMEHRPKPCASCGAQVKAGTERDNTCLDCYKLHTEIVKMEKSNKPSSCDSKLQGLINDWTAELPHKQMVR